MSIIRKMIRCGANLRMHLKRISVVFMFLGLGACTTMPENRTSLADLYDSSMDAYLKNDYLTAEQGLNMLSRRYPQDELVWFRLGNIYARTNRPELAIQAYEEALLRDASAAKPWHNKGMLEVYKAFYTFSDMLLEIGSENPFYPRASEIQRNLSDIIEMEFLPIEHTGDECSGKKLWSEMHEHDKNYKVMIPVEDQLEPSGCEDSAHFIKVDSSLKNPVQAEIEAGVEIKEKLEKSTDIVTVEVDAEMALKKQLDEELATAKMLETDGEAIVETQLALIEQKANVEIDLSDSIVEYDLEFDYGSDEISERASEHLDGMLADLVSIKNIKIQGVTGNKGSADNNLSSATRQFNKQLAERRSNNVLAYLLKGGAPASLVEVLPWDPLKEGFKVVLIVEH